MNVSSNRSLPEKPKICFFQSVIACEYSRFSFLLVAKDILPGGTSATQRQKFHTNDIKAVWNLVRRSDWSTYWLYCFNNCLRIDRQKATKFKCSNVNVMNLLQNSQYSQNIFLFRNSSFEFCWSSFAKDHKTLP